MRTADLVIVGAGVAGLSAAAVAAAWGLDVLVVEHLAPGGQIATVDLIRNFPGFPAGIGGHELGPLLLEQAEAAGAAFLFDSVEAIVPGERDFIVRCAGEELRARSVLLATGSSRRALAVPGEAELEGRGVSHCASCDGQFFRGRPVVVAGGGDSASDEAEILAQHAAEVVIVHDTAAPVARAEAIARIAALPNVRTRPSSTVTAVEGNGEVERVILAAPDGASAEPAAGLFVYVGLDPNAALAGGLAETDDRGAIIADASFQTRCPGLFVAGDVRSGATPLLASVAGDAAAAAHAVLRYLRVSAAEMAA